MQDEVYPKTKPKDSFRIAVIGDSYTFAPYMQYTDTFPKVLERMLNQNITPKKGEVLNLGVPRYSTHHEASVAKDAVLYSPDLILLQITLNDAELKPYWPTGLSEDQQDRFGEMRVSGWKGTLFNYWHLGRFVASRIHNSSTHKEYVKYFYEQFKNPRGFKKFKESVKSIAETSRSNGAKIVAVVFPLFGIPLDDRYPFHDLANTVIGVLKEYDIPALDLFPPFKGIPLDQIQVIPNEDRHPNEIGHRIAAEHIYLWLEKEGFIPEELKIKEKFRLRIGTVKQPLWEGE